MDKKPNSASIGIESNGKSPLLSYPVSVPIGPEEGGWSLSQLLTIARRRAWLIMGVAIAATAVSWVGALTQKPQYAGGFRLLVETATEDGKGLPGLTDTNRNRPNTKADYVTQIQVLSSQSLLRPIVQSIQLQYPDVTYGSLVSALTISQPPDTKILDIKYQDFNAQKVRFVLDELATGYMKYGQQMKQTSLRNGIAFVNEQVNKAQKRVDTLQRQLQRFRQQNNFIDPTNKAEKVSSQVSGLEQQEIETEKQLAEVEKIFTNLTEDEGIIATLANSANYQKLRGQLQEIESKIAIESARFKPIMPQIQLLENQRDNLLPLLQQEARQVMGEKLAEIKNQITVLEVRQQAIAKAKRQWQRQAQQLPVSARQFTDLQRELTVANDSLNRFLQIRETLQVEASQKEIPWQLIQPPSQVGAPINSTSRSLIMGAITGLLLGIAAAFVAERLNNTFYTAEELKQRFKLPLVGIIPFQTHLDSYTATTILARSLSQGTRQLFGGNASPQTTSVFLEAFRSLYANLQRLNPHLSLQSVVVSSALPGDGKSTVAIFLAQAAAAMGKRVLLVDADLRSPQISNLLGLIEADGLSNLLETDLHPNRVIQQLPAPEDGRSPSAARRNLSILASGPIPLDPTQLLASPKMPELADYFQTIFDLVIYDMPPVLSLADSNLLAVHTNGLLLVAGLGQTDRTAVADAVESLQLAHIPILGLVANCIRKQTSSTAKRYGGRLTPTLLTTTPKVIPPTVSPTVPVDRSKDS
jgi:polysaccharide biosynthesis transport protein